MRTFVVSAFRISCAVASAMLLYFAATYVSVRSVGNSSSSDTADAIVVMGAAQYDGVPSALLEARLENALALYQQKRAPLIAVTGGKQTGDRFTEAATSRRWLNDRGVPDSVILSETTGSSTWESLVNIAPVLRDNNVRRVIVSTSRWHVQRTVLSLRELGFHAIAAGVAGAPVSAAEQSGAIAERAKYLRESVGVAIGRIVSFERLFSLTG